MSGSNAPRSPRWTRRRLIDALIACYGTRDGQLDIEAVAADHGVTPATVKRWLAGRSGRVKPRIPAKRLLQLQQPPPEVLRNERMVADNARTVIAGLSRPRGRGVKHQWKSLGWLDPHIVAVLALNEDRSTGVRLHQLAMTRGTPRQLDRLHKRGDVIDHTIVPTRFHAIALIAEVMEKIQPWRLIPSAGYVQEGRTQTFASDAPVPDLAAFARTHALHTSAGEIEDSATHADE